nr:immunoglobulin light chain junction region [Macaca mulatta]
DYYRQSADGTYNPFF